MAPTGLYAHLKAYYNRGKEPEIPPLTVPAAVSLLGLYTLVYVLPFYLSATTRPSPQLSRDAPSVIRARVRSVIISCTGCSVATLLILSSTKHGDLFSSCNMMGYYPLGLEETFKILLLTAILFAGPLFEAGIAEGGWRDWIRLRGLKDAISGWIGWRNYIAGPVTEEILFRSASVPLLLLACVSNTKIIFLTPVIFGFAHVHHFYEFRITHPHTPMITAVLRSVLQFTYTTLFGGYVTFLYMRTGSLLGVILVHAFCNWRGLPRFWGRMRSETLTGTHVGEEKRNENGIAKASNDGRLGIMWDLMYYSLLVGGLMSWYRLLWTLTESDSALATF